MIRAEIPLLEKGSYGTARFMDKRRMKELLDVTGIQKTEGTILGTVDGAVVSIPVTVDES